MTFSRTRKALSRLRSGVTDAGTLANERARGSDLFRSDADGVAFKGVRARLSRAAMLGAAAVSGGLSSGGDSPLFSWDPENGDDAIASQSFSRPSSAFMFNESTGLYQSFASGEPRIIQGIGYLSEGATSNILTRNANFSTHWSVVGLGSASDTVETLGIGSATADDIDAGVGTSTGHGLQRFIGAATAGTPSTLYAIVEDLGGRYFLMRGQRWTGINNPWTVFDLVSGTATGNASVDRAGVIEIKSGIFLCWMTYTPSGSNQSSAPLLGITDDATPPDIANSNDSSWTSAGEEIRVYHSHLYDGDAYPTTPLSASGGTTARSRDLLTGTSWIATAPYTIITDVTFPEVLAPSQTDDGPLFQLGASATDRLTAYASGANAVIDLITSNFSLSTTLPLASVEGQRLGVSIRMEEDNAALQVGGQNVVQATSTGTIPTGDLGIGAANTDKNFRGIIHSVDIY